MKHLMKTVALSLALSACATPQLPAVVSLKPIGIEIYPELPEIINERPQLEKLEFGALDVSFGLREKLTPECQNQAERSTDFWLRCGEAVDLSEVFVTLDRENYQILLVNLAKIAERERTIERQLANVNALRKEWSARNVEANEKLEQVESQPVDPLASPE